MADVTLAAIDEMEPAYHGLARRARASLGVTAWGMQVFVLPPGFDRYPEHAHEGSTDDAGQEEVYVPLDGSGTLVAGDERYALAPGVMVRVGPEQRRGLEVGPDGLRVLVLGGTPGAFRAPAWTELDGPLPRGRAG